jgi:hypothetical protein
MRKALLVLAMLSAPRAALACPVCFGQSDAPMAVATNMGIWMMLGVVAVMLGAFASFFVYLMRRAKLVAANEASRTAEAGHYLSSEEGTAQC